MKLLRHAIPLLLHTHIVELTYFVTSRCNYKCRHCFMQDQLNRKEDELSVDELRKMSESIRPLQRVHIGGGEPFLRKDISNIVQVIANEWQAEVICLPTNGSIRQNLLKTIHDYSINCSRQLRLHFSLNTLADNFSEFTQSKDTFQQWEEVFQEAKLLTNKSQNITLLTLLTFNDFNQGYIDNLLKYVTTSLCPDDVSIGLVRPHKYYQPILDTDKYCKIVDHYFTKHSKQNPFLKVYRTTIREYMAKYYSASSLSTKCFSGKMRVVMSPCGDIYPCETEGYPEGSKRASFLMGNIRDFNYNIKALLKSRKANAVLNEIGNRRCHCSQGIDLSLSLLSSNSFKMKILYKGILTIVTDNLNRFRMLNK